jgi:hypothetical protein
MSSTLGHVCTLQLTVFIRLSSTLSSTTCYHPWHLRLTSHTLLLQESTSSSSSPSVCAPHSAAVAVYFLNRENDVIVNVLNLIILSLRTVNTECSNILLLQSASSSPRYERHTVHPASSDSNHGLKAWDEGAVCRAA